MNTTGNYLLFKNYSKCFWISNATIFQCDTCPFHIIWKLRKIDKVINLSRMSTTNSSKLQCSTSVNCSFKWTFCHIYYIFNMYASNTTHTNTCNLCRGNFSLALLIVYSTFLQVSKLLYPPYLYVTAFNIRWCGTTSASKFSLASGMFLLSRY